uniref:Uncharacterized protein n=1 Tax=Moorena producens (strain JHB) TaxID=1454205 RepID=A0A1D9G1Z2_MOOP1
MIRAKMKMVADTPDRLKGYLINGLISYQFLDLEVYKVKRGAQGRDKPRLVSPSAVIPRLVCGKSIRP